MLFRLDDHQCQRYDILSLSTDIYVVCITSLSIFKSSENKILFSIQYLNRFSDLLLLVKR